MADQPREERPCRADVAKSPGPSRDFIAERLRGLFRSAELEPLPEELQSLLDRLAREEKEGS
ncbi:MAG: hypothetical protein R6V44_06805 [Paracoccaceae bacterium]